MYYYISLKGKFVISYIKEPGLKLYFCNIEKSNDTLKFSDNIDCAMRFRSREVVQSFLDNLLTNFSELDLMIENVGG